MTSNAGTAAANLLQPGCKAAAQRFITAWDVAGAQGAASVQFRAPLFAEFVRWYGADGNAMWLPASEVLGAVGSSVGNILAVQSLRSAQDFAWLRVSIDK
eukprot:gene9884-14646_t